MSLNHAQTEAVAHNKGPCMVLAGPGSGKTLTIAKRIEYLIMKHKVRPEEILVITFTKYAAWEMKNRTRSICGPSSYAVTFGTFHGIYYGILKWAYRLNQSNLLSDEEKYRILREILPGIDWDQEPEADEEKDYLQELAIEIGNVKNNCMDIEEYEPVKYTTEKFRKLYRTYEETKKKYRKIDFEDMLIQCRDLFMKRPDILKKWQEKFQYILVDEFQDVNQAQYDVVRMLAAPQDNLFVVGDDDQSVYGFRGADTKLMLGFPNEFPGTRLVYLNTNYRCSSAIVESACRIIKNNKERYKKAIHSAFEKSQCERVHVIEVDGMRQETDGIVQKIRKMNQNGIPYSNIAVLYRTNSEPSGLAMKLMQSNIPFRVKDSIPDLMSHFVVVNILDYIKAALGNRERALFLRIINRPNRYVSRESLETDPVDTERMKEFYRDNNRLVQNLVTLEADLRRIAELKPYAAVNYIRKAVGYDEYLKEYASYRGINPQEYMDIADEFQEMARDSDSFIEWFNFLNEYRIKLKEQMKTTDHTRDAVVLATMHGAKGLEFDQVFIMNAVEGMTPHKKSVADAELEEERRMFYVAVTRARYGLYIYVPKVVYGKAARISRFVTEMVVDHDMLQIGNKIIHKRYGRGVITFVDDKKICVYFEKDQITKTLSIEYTIKNNLVTMSEDD